MIDHSVLCSSQDHLKTGTCDFDHPTLADAKNTDNWCIKNGDLQHAFPLNVLMLPSYVHCSDKTRQPLVEGPVPSSGSYGP
jgi:hypothetical protein